MTDCADALVYRAVQEGPKAREEARLGYRTPQPGHGRLINGKALDAKYKAHTLSGNYDGYWECHIGPDFLLIWYYSGATDLVFARTGSHSDLFE